MPPYLIHVAHCDRGVEHVVQAACCGLEAGRGETAKVLYSKHFKIFTQDLLRYSAMLYQRKKTASPMLRNTIKHHNGRLSFLLHQ